MFHLKALTSFHHLLATNLSNSRADDRANWAKEIISKDWSVLLFSDLLFEEKRTALSFSWLLSDIGLQDNARLFTALPELLSLSPQVTTFDFRQSFATYWSIVGIPEENKAEAIDLLYHWLTINTTNVTTKSRAAKALYRLSETHHKLQQELRLYSENVKDQHSYAFQRQIQSILQSLNKLNKHESRRTKISNRKIYKPHQSRIK